MFKLIKGLQILRGYVDESTESLSMAGDMIYVSVEEYKINASDRLILKELEFIYDDILKSYYYVIK